MNIQEFHQAAREAFRGAWVKTAIALYTDNEALRYALTVLPEDDEPEYADALTPQDAIRKVRDKLALQRENKIKAARKLLGIEE